MNRREFVASACAAGALVVALRPAGAQVSLIKHASTQLPLGDFVRIAANGDVLYHFTKHEMGQGVATAMAQILCEELCADWSRVKIEFPLVDLPRYENERYGGYGTGGSCTLIYTYDMLRQAGAAVRQMLVNAAAELLDVPAAELFAENHFVVHKATSRRLSFGELAPLAAQLPIPDHVELKDERSFTLIGRPTSSKLTPQIVTGALKYGSDIKLPGMRYALIARCPVFKGKLKRYDARAALKIKGVHKIFTTQPIAGLQEVSFLPHDIREGVVVVADSFWAAFKAREALEIEWDEGEIGKLSSADFERLTAERARQRTDPTGFIGAENAVADLARVRKTLRASYVYPHQLHSCMETLNCTAHVREDECELWLGTQSAGLVVSEVARLLDLPEDRIKLHMLPSGGGFGRRAYTDMAVEAAFISREAGNIPVKMMWTREDDQRCNLAHLFQHMEYQAGLDAENRLYALHEKEIRTYTWGEQYANPSLPRMAYDIANLRYDFEDLGSYELLQSSAWRGVDVHGRALSECFIDEIAAEVGRDPLEFRLSLLTPGREIFIGGEHTLSSDRMRALLELTAQKAGYRASLPQGRGMGIALIPYASSYCCAVADVTVTDGRLTINKITAAVDCGRIINPSGAEQQIVGGIIWGLTALFYGGAPVVNGRIQHSNFHENRLLRMHECPPIEAILVDSPEPRPLGLGEMACPLAVPAVLNAIFAATGKRIRRIPLPADLRNA
jgi:isoquinoline 1-oxidoreductase beta subunit